MSKGKTETLKAQNAELVELVRGLLEDCEHLMRGCERFEETPTMSKAHSFLAKKAGGKPPSPGPKRRPHACEKLSADSCRN